MCFSVLISVFDREKPNNLERALISIWDDQSLKPSQIVIVKDGKLTEELDLIIEDFIIKTSGVVEVVAIDKNVGLAEALNEGLKHCRYDLVARMDTDDISLPDRFLVQVKFMKENKDVAVSSAWIDEYDQAYTRKISRRKLPESHDDILKFAKYRNPISHPVVIFRKKVIDDNGGYPSFRKSQDYALWSILLSKGHKFYNISEVLLHMRAGSGLMSRRGFSYLKNEYKIILFQKKIGFLKSHDVVFNMLSRTVLRISPSFFKKFLYKFFRSI